MCDLGLLNRVDVGSKIQRTGWTQHQHRHRYRHVLILLSFSGWRIRTCLKEGWLKQRGEAFIHV